MRGPVPAPLSAHDALACRALADIPKILTLQDRTPVSPTYGCFDRAYWHYRMMDFPCGMSQEFVLPLALASGAGANSRIAIGTSVVGGMLTATALAIFYIPLFFVLVRRGVRDGLKAARERLGHKPETDGPETNGPETGDNAGAEG